MPANPFAAECEVLDSLAEKAGLDLEEGMDEVLENAKAAFDKGKRGWQLSAAKGITGDAYKELKAMLEVKDPG